MKNPHNNTKKNKAVKIRTNPDPESTFAWRTIPISNAMVNSYVKRLEDWVEANVKRCSITQFLKSIGVARTTWYDLLQKHEHLKMAHENAMRRLGEEKLEDSMYFKANWAVVKHTLHTYAPEFKEMDLHHSSMKEAQNAAMGIQTVNLPAIPRTEVLDEHLNKRRIGTNDTLDK